MLPFLLSPYLKTVIWGGSSLSEYKQLDTHLDHLGETWELSTISGCESTVASGQHAGMLLSELCKLKGAELLGQSIVDRFGHTVPLIVKFIDAADDLSIQVHPNEDMAARRYNCHGKSEMWYIINAEEGANLVNGFNTEVSAEEFRSRIVDGTLNDILHRYDAKAGDIFYLPAGRVHAIGRGTMIYEVQQATDITYRIFDYNRLDANGNPRQLHVDEAIEAIDREANMPGTGYSLPAQTPYFKLEKAELSDSSIEILSDNFCVATCINGSAIASAEGSKLELKQGHTMMIPALTATTLSGTATLLIAKP